MNSSNRATGSDGGAGACPALAQRVLLAALAFMVALSTLAAATAIAELHDHDCTGDDCPICLTLNLAQALLTTSADSATAIAALVAAFAFSLPTSQRRTFGLKAETPVSQRVRLII